jgi:hypothetical protein
MPQLTNAPIDRFRTAAMSPWTPLALNDLLSRHGLDIRVTSAQPFANGFWNTVLHLATDQGDLVLKHYRKMPQGSLCPNLPTDEAKALHRLQGLNVAPDLIVALPGARILIYRYLPGPEWHSDVTAAAHLMRRQSRADPTGFRTVPTQAHAILTQADQILSRCRPDTTTAILQACRPIPQTPMPAAPLSLIHTDPAPANMIGAGPALRLIDWQCPGAGDLAEDVSVLFSPAFRTLYDRPLLTVNQRSLFLQTLDIPALTARLPSLEPAYAWRLACYCAHRMQTTPDPSLADRYRQAALTQAACL